MTDTHNKSSQSFPVVICIIRLCNQIYTGVKYYIGVMSHYKMWTETQKCVCFNLNPDIQWVLKKNNIQESPYTCVNLFFREIILEKVLINMKIQFDLADASSCTKRDNPEVYRRVLSYCQCPRCWPKSHPLRFRENLLHSRKIAPTLCTTQTNVGHALIMVQALTVSLE